MIFKMKCYKIGVTFIVLKLPLKTSILVVGGGGKASVMSISALDFPDNICQSAFDESESFKS